MTEHRITAGFMPLMDCLILAIAREKGFATAEGIDLTLLRETSWANIRDRIAVGHFDVAHMLGPMPIAAALGLIPIAAPIFTPFALGLGGNAITVKLDLWRRMADAGAPADLDAAAVGAALAGVVRAGGPKLRIAVVHHHSSQNYELRYWLAACGIRPDEDVDIVVVPPPLMAEALASEGIDGYCVGEPWNSVGVAAGTGRIVTTKSKIWRASPEKVVGVSGKWAGKNPQALTALLRALAAAAAWCAVPANHPEAASILAAPRYLDVAAELILRSLSGRIETLKGLKLQVDGFFIPQTPEANVPSHRHALWFYSQMVRWGQTEHSVANARRAAESYRPELYRAALPGVSVESARSLQTFFDGRTFDPEKLEDYLAAQ